MNPIPTTRAKAPQRRARLDDVPRVCWCGQDLQYAQRGHCPRCGRAPVSPSRVMAMAPAA